MKSPYVQLKNSIRLKKQEALFSDCSQQFCHSSTYNTRVYVKHDTGRINHSSIPYRPLPLCSTTVQVLGVMLECNSVTTRQYTAVTAQQPETCA